MLYSHPDLRDFVVDSFVSLIKEKGFKPDSIAGTATAAIGWAALVADRMHLPFVYVRSKPKEHGAKKRIEGDLKPGSHVIVIEDLLSTGGSATSTVDALRTEAGATVTDVCAIFSYEMASGKEKESESQVTFHPLSNLTVLLSVAEKQGRFTKEDTQKISTFAADPAAWEATL